MNDRIALILKYKNISATKFADEIEVQRSSISHILSERNKPSLEFIQKILKTYSEISPEWLISGKGSMIKNPDLFTQGEGMLKGNKDDKIQMNQDVETYHKEQEMQKPNITATEIPYNKKEIINKSEKAPKKHQNKEVEKILVFYSDSTFKEYFPHNDD